MILPEYDLPHTSHERMGTICEGLVELMKRLTKMAANYSNTILITFIANENVQGLWPDF